MHDFRWQSVVRAALAAVLLVGASGCYTIVRDETFDYRKPVQIRRDQLRTDGYYCTKQLNESSNYLSGTSIQCYILWQNGTALRFPGVGKIEHREIGRVVYGSLEEAHQAFKSYVDSLSGLPSWGERKPSAPWWGAYRIRHDSIFIQSMYDEVSGAPAHRFVAVKDTGTLVNDTAFTIRGVKAPSECQTDTTWCSATYRFHPWDDKPDSTNWLHERYR